MAIRCFFLTPTEQVRHQLRRYTSNSPCPAMPGHYSYHNAMSAMIGILTVPIPSKDSHEPVAPYVSTEDPRWPNKCDRCDYLFDIADPKQSWTERLMKRSDNGELTTIRDAPPGAMWNAWWMGPLWQGSDGMSLNVRCPDGHDWCIDGRASNCTLPNDNVHRCWVRHGVPPEITVDKNGHTCSAGGGSIQTPQWHGFLRGGSLVE